MKFGGTSVAGIEKIKNIVNIISKEVKENKVIVVLSAMAGETSKLQDYLNELDRREQSGEIERLPKKEAALIRREYNKLNQIPHTRFLFLSYFLLFV